MDEVKEYTLAQSQLGGPDTIAKEGDYSFLGGLFIVGFFLLLIGAAVYDKLRE